MKWKALIVAGLSLLLAAAWLLGGAVRLVQAENPLQDQANTTLGAMTHAQGQPNRLYQPTQEPSIGDRELESDQPGGPAQGFFGGVLTALGAISTALGFALLLGLFMVAVLFVVVWLSRGKTT